MRLIFSVPPDDGKTALGSISVAVCGGSGCCSLTIDVSLGQTNWSTCETDGVVSCWLIVSWFICRLWTVVHLPFSSSVFFQNTPYIYVHWNARSRPEGKLAQVSVLVPDQLEDNADLGKGRTRLGRACYQFLDS